MPTLVSNLRNRSESKFPYNSEVYFTGNYTSVLCKDYTRAGDNELQVRAGLWKGKGRFLDLVSTKCRIGINLSLDRDKKYGLYYILIPFYPVEIGNTTFAIRLHSHKVEDLTKVFGMIFTNTELGIKKQFEELAANKLGNAGNVIRDIANWYAQHDVLIITKIKKDDRLSHLKLLLSDSNLPQYGLVNKEKSVLNILRSFSPHWNGETRETRRERLELTQATFLLENLLIINPVTRRTYFDALYTKLNDWGGDDNFTTGMELLCEIWGHSKYIFPSIREYFPFNSPVNIPYVAKKLFVASESEVKLKFNGETIEAQIKNYEWLVTDGMSIRKTVSSTLHKYHLFQPITAFTKDGQHALPIGKYFMPAFYLKAAADKQRWAIIEQRIFIAIDIASVLAGIGILWRLKTLVNLSKAQRFFAILNGTLQVSSGAVGTMLTLLEDDIDPKFKDKLRTVLLYIDLATLSGDFITNSMLKKAARETLDAATPTVRGKQGWVEVEEELEIILEIERRGINTWDGGKLLSERMLRKRITTLLEKYKNFNLKVVFLEDLNDIKRTERWDKRNTLGALDIGPPPRVILRKQVTELTWQHELWHLEDLKKMGSAKFYATPLWKHEELVWERILNTRQRWTENELVDSYRYYKNKAKYETGKWISNKEMEEMLENPYYKFIRYKK